MSAKDFKLESRPSYSDGECQRSRTGHRRLSHAVQVVPVPPVTRAMGIRRSACTRRENLSPTHQY